MPAITRKWILPLCLLLAACTKSTCPPDTVSYLTPPYPPEDINQVSAPQQIMIGRQEILVDQVISGELCNDTWSGTVYVTCDIQVPAWDQEADDALFLQDCDLNIAEGTIVYVEAHGSQPYYQGCSCHE